METLNEVVVITVPLPAQSHLNQMLQLSCLLSSYHVPVHYVASALHIRQVRARVIGLDPLDIARINFHQFPTPTFDSPPPDPNSSHKFPSQLQLVYFSTFAMREPFAAYLQSMSEKFRRVIVVHDSMMSAVVQDVGSIHNAESYALNAISAFSLASFICKSMEKQFPGIEHLAGLPSFDECVPYDIKYFSTLQFEAMKHRSGDLYNTCRLMEGPYLELLECEENVGNRKSWAIGPILPVKPSSSPEGFEESVKGVGLVVRDWAPQPEVLAHPSTGGFMSHCGWNSCIESITMEVPVATRPMHSDQPVNAALIVDILKTGLPVRQLSSDMEVVRASTIGTTVKRLMASEEGDGIRKRAEELAATLQKATQPGGASRLELDSFIAHITRQHNN